MLLILLLYTGVDAMTDADKIKVVVTNRNFLCIKNLLCSKWRLNTAY